MKNKIIAIVLSVTCVLASCLPSALTNFNHIETEEVSLEEANETPTWDILYKGNDEAMKAYQETYDRVYKETYDNITKQQAEIQATTQANQQNLQDVFNQIASSDIYKWFQANNEKVVKDIDTDKNGNLVVKYSNGTSKNIALASTPTVTPTPNANIYEQVGYSVPIVWNCNTGGHAGTSTQGFDYTISNLSIKLVNVDSPTKYDPYTYFTYEVSIDYTTSNLVYDHISYAEIFLINQNINGFANFIMGNIDEILPSGTLTENLKFKSPLQSITIDGVSIATL